MQLIRTSFLSGLSTLAKLLTGFISLKVVAMYAGPQGVAILGQFNSFVSILAVIAGGGITLGIIKYVAEYAASKEDLQRFLSDAFSYTLLFSAMTMVLGLIFSKDLSQWILASQQYRYLICWLSFAQIFIAIYLFISSVFNGFKNINMLVKINLLTSLTAVIVMCTLTMLYGLKGCLGALILSQSMYGFIALYFARKQPWITFYRHISLKVKHFKNLSKYSLMNIVSAVSMPISQIVVRKYLLILLGWEFVGYWQAVVRLSDAYLLFVTTVLTSYFLPKLSELTNLSQMKHEIMRAYTVILPAMFIMLGIIYCFRSEVILILYSSKFTASKNLFLFQLLGDFFRTAGWITTYLLLAKSWTKTYIITEVVLAILFVILGKVMIYHDGLIGVTYAFALTYFIYWLMMIVVMIYFFKREAKLCLQAPNL